MALTKEQAEAVRKQILEQLKKLPKEQVGNLPEQIKKASPEELEAFVNQMQARQSGAAAGKGGECIFCKIIKGEIDTVKIYEDQDILAVLDIMPASKGHIIVMPKKHIQFIQELSESLLNKIMHFVKLISPAIIQLLKAQSLSIYIPQGQLAGQAMPHFIVNIIPRYEKDNVSIGWNREKADLKELEKVAVKIRKVASTHVINHIAEEKKKVEVKRKKKETSEAEKMYKRVKKRRP